MTNRGMAGRVRRYGKRRAMRSWPLSLRAAHDGVVGLGLSKERGNNLEVVRLDLQVSALLRPRPRRDHRRAGGADRLRVPARRQPPRQRQWSSRGRIPDATVSELDECFHVENGRLAPLTM
jgi:hypothetical protein